MNRLLTALAASRALRALRDPERAARAARFFQAHPGGYGEGDAFLGLTVPQVRLVARSYRDLALPALETLLASKYHEERLFAVIILAERARRSKLAQERDELARFYLAHLDGVNQWDLVDSSAHQILGAYFAERSRAPLYKLARSKNVWRRRIAVLTTFAFIRKDDYEDTLALATRLLNDEHDLIHKAVGWMLREVGTRDSRVLEAFLDEHAARMPRTMLRYAIEKLPDAKRRRFRERRIMDEG